MTDSTLPAAAEPAHLRASYRGVFRSSEFRALFTAHVVSMLGTMVAEVALTVLVFDRTGSPALAALTFTVGFLPYLFGGTLLSGLVDRWPARRTMVTCDVLSAAVFVVMAVPGVPVGGLLALSFAAGLVAPVFSGARAALLPALLGPGPVYVLGRATMRVVSQGAQVLGFAVGGVLLSLVGARAALLVDAASFVVSAVVLRAGMRVHATVSAPASSLVRDSLAGVRAVLAHGPSRRLLLLRWLVPTCALAPEALAVPYVHAVHGTSRALGLYLAAVPAAMVATDLLVGRLAPPRWQRRLVLPGALLATLPLLGFATMPGLWPATALLAVAGVGYCHGLGLDALLLRTVPAALQARALAVDQAGLMFLQGIGFAVWGLAGQLLPLRVAIALAGALGAAVVTTWAVGEPGRRTTSRSITGTA